MKNLDYSYLLISNSRYSDTNSTVKHLQHLNIQI